MFRPLAVAAVMAVLFPGFALSARAANVTVLVKPGVRAFQPGEKMPQGVLVFPTIQKALDHGPQPTDGGRVIYLDTYMPKGILPRNFLRGGDDWNPVAEAAKLP